MKLIINKLIKKIYKNKKSRIEFLVNQLIDAKNDFPNLKIIITDYNKSKTYIATNAIITKTPCHNIEFDFEV